jgi:hypothetical protein
LPYTLNLGYTRNSLSLKIVLERRQEQNLIPNLICYKLRQVSKHFYINLTR